MTQVETLADAEQQVRDLIETALEEDASGAELAIRFDVGDLRREAEEARDTVAPATADQAETASTARLDALIERLEDAEDRLSVHEREGVTMDFDELKRELGL